MLFITSEFINCDKSLFPGGLATYTYNICKILQKNGIEPTVFSLGSYTVSEKFDNIDCIIYRNSTFRVKKILFFLTFRIMNRSIARLLDSFMIYLGTRRILNNFDIIHCSNWKHPALFLRKKSNFVLRISSYEKFWDNEPNNFTIDKWLCKKLEGFEIVSYNNIIGPGLFILQTIQRDLNKSAELIPTPFIKPQLEKIPSKEPLKFLYVGTLSYSKGVDLLLDLVDYILNKYDKAEFAVVGKLSNVNVEYTRRRIYDLYAKFNERFEHINYLNKSDLNNLYQKSEILCIPSVYDNFPNVALEAMSNDCIVIASNTSSLETLIISGENGYIVEDRNVEAWGLVIDNIINLKTEEKSMIKFNIKDKLTCYAPEYAGKLLINYYKKIIENNET